MYRILRVGTHPIHSCSHLSSLIFIIKILRLFHLLPSLHLVRPAVYDTLNSNPFFYWGALQECLQVGDWPILRGSKQTFQGWPMTSSALLHTDHWRQKSIKDPKVWLAVELGPQPRRLQEQSPVMHAWAPSQKGAQSGCRQRPHQLVDGELACPNKVEAAHQVQPPGEACLFQACLSWRNSCSAKMFL